MLGHRKLCLRTHSLGRKGGPPFSACGTGSGHFLPAFLSKTLITAPPGGTPRRPRTNPKAVGLNLEVKVMLSEGTGSSQVPLIADTQNTDVALCGINFSRPARNFPIEKPKPQPKTNCKSQRKQAVGESLGCKPTGSLDFCGRDQTLITVNSNT